MSATAQLPADHRRVVPIEVTFTQIILEIPRWNTKPFSGSKWQTRVALTNTGGLRSPCRPRGGHRYCHHSSEHSETDSQTYFVLRIYVYVCLRWCAYHIPACSCRGGQASYSSHPRCGQPGISSPRCPSRYYAGSGHDFWSAETSHDQLAKTRPRPHWASRCPHVWGNRRLRQSDSARE